MDIQEIPFEIIDRIGKIKGISFPRQGHTSRVAVLETADHRYVIKKTEHGLYNEWLTEEYKALQYLSETGLPVPKVYALCTVGTSRWLLMDYINGISLREFLSEGLDLKAKEKAISHFGVCLKTIHECPCPAELRKSEHLWLDAMLMKAEYNLTHFEVDGSRELRAHLMKKKPEPIENTLIHGDFTIDNVLTNNGNIMGIIDWSGAAYGDPRYDAALAIRPKANAFDNRRDRDIFFESYGRFRITDEEYGYFEEGLYEFF